MALWFRRIFGGVSPTSGGGKQPFQSLFVLVRGFDGAFRRSLRADVMACAVAAARASLVKTTAARRQCSELRRIHGAFRVVDRADGSRYRTLHPAVRERVLACAAEVLREPGPARKQP